MGIIQPEKCCCFSLRTGAMILGIIGLIASVSSFLSSAITAAEFDKNTVPDDMKPYVDYYYAVWAYFIPSGVIEICVHLALLYGVEKERHGFLLPWLIMNMVNIVVSIDVILSH